MSERDADAIATIALIAALADGRRQDEERTELTRIADRLAGRDFGRQTAAVLAGKVRLADVVARLEDEASRREAFEAAVSICYADDVATDAERAFLRELRVALGLDPEAAAGLERDAAGLSAADRAGPIPAPAAEPPAGRPSQAGLPALDEDDGLSGMILNTAVLAAALELLPQRLASLAIVPLQGRMVYQVGADYGHRLDAAQIADLAGAVGVGAAAQLVEGSLRRVLGGAARAIGGSLAGHVGRAATSAALTFATTYALGHAARRYYAQGRRLDRDDLRGLFEQFRGEAADLFPRMERAVRSRAETLDLGDLLAKLRA